MKILVYPYVYYPGSKHQIFKKLLSLILIIGGFTAANAQVGAGFFNDASFGSFTSALTGTVNGVSFNIARSGTYATNKLNAYYPGNLPAYSGYPTTAPGDHELMAAAANNYMQYNFSANLPIYTVVYVQDVDVNEDVRVEFLTASNTLINTSQLIYRSIATAQLPNVFINPTNIEVQAPNAADGPESLVAFIIQTNSVRKIRVTQLSTQTVGTYEVYFGLVQQDHGDAPNTYGDAIHEPNSNLTLGNITPDAEITAAYSANANGDNSSNGTNIVNDEDGVGYPLAVSMLSTTYSASVTLRNQTGANAILYGYIDFNKNGNFTDAGEKSAPVTVPNGTTSATVTWSGYVIPAVGNTFARFRIASVAAEVSSPTGFSSSGEVEDYRVLLNTTILPVTWKTINAKKVDDKIAVNWTTANEIDNKYFDIEKSSDGYTFSPIGKENQSTDNTSLKHSYTFFDNHPFIGDNYYRIKQVDQDGKYSYSQIVKVKFIQSVGIAPRIFPNPVLKSGSTTLDVGTQSTSLQLLIFAQDGRMLYKSNLKNAERYVNVPVKNLPAGICYVRAIADGESLPAIKLLIQ